MRNILILALSILSLSLAYSSAYAISTAEFNSYFKQRPVAPKPMNDFLKEQEEKMAAARKAQAEAEKSKTNLQQLSAEEYVPRNSFTISREDIESAIGAVLEQKGAAEHIGASVSGYSTHMPVFSYSEPLRVVPRGLRFDSNKKTWQASVLFVNEQEEVISALPASGRYNELAQIPVLRQLIRKGELITQDNIEMRDVLVEHTRSDTIQDAQLLIGKTPSRSISAGRPIRATEIIDLPVIEKNALVQVQYTVPGMIITATGQALSEGAKGELIEVRNSASKKVVRGMVIDATTVQVVAPNLNTQQLAGVQHANF